MRTKGKLTTWNDDKGYGFIEPLDGGQRVFIHIKAFANRRRRPVINQVVTYALSRDKQGRPSAARATLVGDGLSTSSRKKAGTTSILIAPVFLLIVAAAVFTTNAPDWIIAAYLVLSLITFIVYALDKSAARAGRWRTPETTLHVLSLLGGWPGALIAQQKLRHKSKKQPFRFVFWLTVFTNSVLLAWILAPGGTYTLRSLLTG